MPADILVDLTPLDTSMRYTGTGRYIHELGLALAALAPSSKLTASKALSLHRVRLLDTGGRLT